MAPSLPDESNTKQMSDKSLQAKIKTNDLIYMNGDIFNGNLYLNKYEKQ
jgi:hypothetical protein